MLTENDVLIGKRTINVAQGRQMVQKTVQVLLAAPLALPDGTQLIETTFHAFGGHEWTGFRPVPGVWKPLCDAVSARLTAEAEGVVLRHRILREQAEAGDKLSGELLRLMGGNPITDPQPVEWTVHETLHGTLSVCRHCGEVMYSRDRNVDFCSARCRLESKRESARRWAHAHKHERPSRARELELEPTCAHCGETFEAKRSDATYCSPRCRQAARRAKKPAEAGHGTEETAGSVPWVGRRFDGLRSGRGGCGGCGSRFGGSPAIVGGR